MMSILSGSLWTSKFPGSKDVDDLEPDFREKVRNFLKALEEAKLNINISATYRPSRRAYLMHWSWLIAKTDQDVQKVPEMPGVYINWWHGDNSESKKAAQEMVNSYSINKLKVPPALLSRHTQRKAIDVTISWLRSIEIKDADGKLRMIPSAPRDGTNKELIEVGKTYGVIHFKNIEADRPHWSTDGR
jgi:hypothetical protein